MLGYDSIWYLTYYIMLATPFWYMFVVYDVRKLSHLVHIPSIWCKDTIPFGLCTLYMMLGYDPIWSIKQYHLIHSKWCLRAILFFTLGMVFESLIKYFSLSEYYFCWSLQSKNGVFKMHTEEFKHVEHYIIYIITEPCWAVTLYPDLW